LDFQSDSLETNETNHLFTSGFLWTSTHPPPFLSHQQFSTPSMVGDNFVNIQHGCWTQCYRFPCSCTYCISSFITFVLLNCHHVKCWLAICMLLLMVCRWTRHHNQLKMFLPWLWNICSNDSKRFYTKQCTKDTPEICSWGLDAVFCWSVAHLNKNTKCQQLLNGFCHASCWQCKKLKPWIL